MTFLQPFMLWGLFMALVPVLIHLINKMRHRPQPWAALQFLLKASRSSVRQQKLKQFLILLCRTLAVAALALFLSRPLVGGWLGGMVTTAPETIVILFDRSASMEFVGAGQTTGARQQALELLARGAKQFEGASHFVLIDSALRAPQEIAKIDGLATLPSTAATDTAADLPGMLQAALSWLVANAAGTTEIWVVSDLQKSNWSPDDSRWKALTAELGSLPQKPRIRLLTFDSSSGDDTSVTVTDVVRKRRGTESELEFVLDFQRSKPSTDPIPLSLNLNGNPSQVEVKMEGSSFRWRHKVALGDKTNGGWGSFALPSDGNKQNNAAYFVYPPELKAQALVVASSVSSSTRAMRFAATTLADGARQPARIMNPAGFELEELDHETLVLWQDELPNPNAAEKLARFVEGGGVALFFPPGGADSNRFLGFGWGEVQIASSPDGFRVVRWDETGGPLGKTDEGLSLPLTQSVFWKRQPIIGTGIMLANFDDRSPFLMRQNTGRGQFLFCASSADPEWSSLAEGTVLVPLVQRLLQEGSRRLYPPLAAFTSELDSTDAKLAWRPVGSNDPKDWRTEAGVFQAGERFLAVNRPLSEDQPDRMESSQLASLFGDLPFRQFNETSQRSNDLQGEFWRVFVFTMLLFLIAEALLILPPKITVKLGTGMTPSPPNVGFGPQNA